MPSENANQKGKAERKLFQAAAAAAGGQSRKEQKHCKSGEKWREGKGDFYRKTTLHIERKMHKAQRTTPKDDTLMLPLTFATTDRTKRGKIQE